MISANRHFVVESWQESARAIAEVVKVASSPIQSQIARFVRELLFEETNSALIQSLQRVVDAIRWEEVTGREREQWLALARTRFLSRTDLHFIATRTLPALSQVEGDQVSDFLEATFKTAPSLDVLAVSWIPFIESHAAKRST